MCIRDRKKRASKEIAKKGVRGVELEEEGVYIVWPELQVCLRDAIAAVPVSIRS